VKSRIVLDCLGLVSISDMNVSVHIPMKVLFTSLTRSSLAHIDHYTLFMRPGHDVKLHPHFHCHHGSFLYWCVMRPAIQRFFIHSCIYLRIYKQRCLTFLWWCAVKQSINHTRHVSKTFTHTTLPAVRLAALSVFVYNALAWSRWSVLLIPVIKFICFFVA